MGFIKKEIPPPDVKKGDVLPAKIEDIAWPLDSNYEKQQIRLDFILSDGYQGKTWFTYYTPGASERSVLGQLLLVLAEGDRNKFRSTDEGLEALKEYGHVYVKVNDFREWNEQQYPKWKVVPDRLPPRTAQIRITPKNGETEDQLKERLFQQYLVDTGQTQKN